MESFGYKPPVQPVRFKNTAEISNFMIENQDYLKYLYNKYPETPLNEWFYVDEPKCFRITPNDEGVMCLYDNKKWNRECVNNVFRHKYY